MPLSNELRIRGLIAGEQAFVLEYLKNGGNGSAAYRAGFPRATPASARAAACRLIQRTAVQRALAEAQLRARAALERELSPYELTQKRLTQRLVTMAFTDIDQVASVVPLLDERGGVVGRQVVVKDLSEVPAEARAAIAEISTDGRGKVAVKLVDRRACLMDIARLKAWTTDRAGESRQVVLFEVER
jgi:phage terminase small subunit